MLMTPEERAEFEWWLDRMSTDPSLVEAMGRQTADDPQFGDILSNWKALHPDEAQKLEAHQRVVRELLLPVYAEARDIRLSKGLLPGESLKCSLMEPTGYTPVDVSERQATAIAEDEAARPDGSGSAGVAMGQQFDLMVLDVILPGMSGFDSCRAVRDRESDGAS